MSRISFLAVLALLGPPRAWTGITYQAGDRIIDVRDYPAGRPCTPADVYRMNRAAGWGLMEYDADRDVYVLGAHMRIGGTDGTDTHFQIGSPAHPHETLVMRGHVIVSPSGIRGPYDGVSGDADRQGINRLRLGEPGQSNVTAALLFDAGSNAAFGLFVGAQPQPDGGYKIPGAHGGALHVYHSRISAARPGADAMAGWTSGNGWFRGFVLAGTASTTVLLDHATLSWIAGRMTSGLQAPHGRVSDTLFEHGGQALVNGRQQASGCLFRRLETAIVDEGGLDAVLTDCRFLENDRNWALAYSSKGLTLVDCAWDTPRKGDVHRRWTDPHGRTHDPQVWVCRHVVVEVKDARGNPLPDVAVTCRAEPAGLHPSPVRIARTGREGRTPGIGQDSALLLTAYVQTATETPDRPATVAFRYTLTAADGGRHAVLTNVVPDVSWKTIAVTLP